MDCCGALARSQQQVSSGQMRRSPVCWLVQVMLWALLAACPPANPSDGGQVHRDAAADRLDAAVTDRSDAAVPDAAREDACVAVRIPVDVMVALGSSSVAGSGASDEAHRFVNLIASGIQAAALVNLGSGGQTGAAVVGAVAQQARDAHPDVVVVMSMTDYASSDGQTMADAWHTVLAPIAGDGARIFFGDLRIDPAWVCAERPTPTGECYSQSDYDMLHAKNAIVAATLGTLSGLTIVPVFDQNAAHPEWNAADGHPNDLGHAFLAQTFLDVMQPALRQWVCGGEGGAGER
jgi:hypothetical protein